jgi:hypothetical protein
MKYASGHRTQLDFAKVLVVDEEATTRSLDPFIQMGVVFGVGVVVTVVFLFLWSR